MSILKSFNQWMVDQGFNAIRHANCCRIAYEGGQQSQQAEINDLKAQLNNMEQCYIDMKKERDGLLDANTAMDRERNQYREQAKVYQSRTNQAKSLIIQFFKLKQDKPEMTLMAVQNSLVGYGEP